MRRLGASAIFGLLAVPLAASSSGWVSARSSHFEVYAHSGADARQTLVRFEQLRAFFEQHTGIQVESHLPLRVLVFSSIAEYSAFRWNSVSDAYFVAGEERDSIVLPDPNSERLAAHEYWHFVEHAGNLRLPLWLNEGLADFFSTVRWETHAGRMGDPPPDHIAALRRGSWIPLPTLLSLAAGAPALSERSQSEMFYAESWALAHMLKLSPAYAPRFPELMERLASGTPTLQALEGVYARPVDWIARDLRTWLHKAHSVPLPAAMPSAPLSIAIAEVPPAEVGLSLAEILLSVGRVDQAESLYREVASEAPENADVAGRLALLALGRHDLTEAREQWQRAIEHGIGDARICYRFAELAEEAGAPAVEVRRALERAVLLDPAYDDALFSLALTENRSGEPAAARRHLRAMRNITPGRRFVYWTAMSDALNELGRRDEAKAAAETAKTWAATAEERAYAERLAYVAETDLAVRFTRDSAGNVRLETARAPHDAADWNPFIEPGDHVRRVEARLREIQCGGAATVFVVETASAVLGLKVPDPTHVQMRNAPAEFTCGPQTGTHVLAVYAETGPATGLLRGLEFQ